MPFASGKNAIGICDRCGWQYAHRELQWQIKDGNNSGWLVCPTCMDEDNPQYLVGRDMGAEAIAIQDPRPDNGDDRSLASYPWAFGWQTFTSYGRINAS